MLKKSEQILHTKLKLLSKGNEKSDCLLNNVEYSRILKEMAFNIKDPNNVTSLFIKNSTSTLLSTKERKQSENIEIDGTGDNLRIEPILGSETSTQINLYNTSKLGNEDACTNQSTDNKNIYKSDLQSLLIMMTINSYEPDDAQNTTNSEANDMSCIPLTSGQKNHEDLCKILNVTSLKKNIDRQKYITKKYLKKWKIYVKSRKEDRIIQERKENVNKFLNKLAMKKQKSGSTPEHVRKSKLLVQDYKSYQHRYKVQKQIIALQKAKLEEQNKMIEELKFNKIVEASNQSLEAIKDGVRETYYDIDRHLKPKIKSLSKELKIRELEEPSLMLHCLKVPQFLQRMEARARERDEKHAIIRERRRQIEEERLRLKQQEEIAKAEMNKEEKNRRMRELKEKRKREKIENIRKKQHDERIRALVVMADLHYEKSLTIKYGIRPFARLVQIKKENFDKAKAHYTFSLKKNVFLHWMWHTEDMWFEKNFKADEFRRKKLLSKAFHVLKQNHYEGVLKRQVAEDYYDLYVTQLAFKKFKDAIVIIKKESEVKLKNAVLYYNSNLLFRTFTCWRTLPALNALQREQEVRKLKWRQKVLLVVPDYTPPED